jgi:glycine hydroxymethyltransferase
LEFGDKVVAMNLAHGGHLTHGHKVNFSGKGWNFVPYGVDQETETINMDEVREIVQKEQPKMVLSGASAYPREVNFKKFAEIAKEVGAISFADPSHISGLIVAGEHQNPFPETDVVMTTTHKTLRGPRGAVIMCKEELAQKIDKAVFPGMQGGPHEHSILGKAVAFEEAAKPEFKNYAQQIVKNAKAMAEALMDKGLRLVSGGTDNHLILCDLTPTGVTGKEAEDLLDQAGITLNKNMIPFDTKSPFNPSGIRMGTPAITSRGFKEDECRQIGDLIAEVVLNIKDESIVKKTREKVLALTAEHPMYD